MTRASAIEVGGKLYPFSSYEEAVRMFRLARTQAGMTGRVPVPQFLPICDETGRKVGAISTSAAWIGTHLVYELRVGQ